MEHLTVRLSDFSDRFLLMKKYARNRILIVDDEPTCLLGTKVMLRAVIGNDHTADFAKDLDALVDVAMNG